MGQIQDKIRRFLKRRPFLIWKQPGKSVQDTFNITFHLIFVLVLQKNILENADG